MWKRVPRQGVTDRGRRHFPTIRALRPKNKGEEEKKGGQRYRTTRDQFESSQWTLWARANKNIYRTRGKGMTEEPFSAHTPEERGGKRRKSLEWDEEGGSERKIRKQAFVFKYSAQDEESG